MTRTISPKYASTVKTRRKSKRVPEMPPMSTPAQTSSKKTVALNILTKLTLSFGIICFIIVINTLIVRTFPVAKQQNFTLTAEKTPVEIIIKAVNIDLPIIPAVFENGTFQTTTNGASYLTSTPIPGDYGNSVIYAHNWTNLFGNLTNVKEGENITILFSNNTQKSFTVTQTQTVSAYQTSILHSFDDTRITLFTCTNFLDADRFVVTANPQ